MDPAFKDNPTSHRRVICCGRGCPTLLNYEIIFHSCLWGLAYAAAERAETELKHHMQRNPSNVTTNKSLMWLTDKALYFHRNRGWANTGAMPFLLGTPAFFFLPFCLCANSVAPDWHLALTQQMFHAGKNAAWCSFGTDSDIRVASEHKYKQTRVLVVYLIPGTLLKEGGESLDPPGTVCTVRGLIGNP